MVPFSPRAIFSYTVMLLLLMVSIACSGTTTPTPVGQPEATRTESAAPSSAATTVPPTVTQPPLAATPTAVLQAVPPTAIATPTPEVEVATVTSTTVRLVASVGRIGLETNLPWAAPSVGFDKRTIYENLIGVKRSTGELIPEIAKEWSVTPDGLTWTFLLRDDVHFHNDWGNVTSKDVKHMFEIVAEGEGGRGEDRFPYQNTIAEVEIVSDTEVRIHQTKPDSFTVIFFNHGGHGTSVLMSKAQWDAEGIEGYQENPIGTGAYRYVTREPATSLLMERVEDHWRHTAEFAELDKRFIEEDATRLAGLLADEIHLVALPRDLRKSAVDRGMVEWNSVLPSVQSMWWMGGQYYTTPELLGDDPWVGEDENAIRVRQALNKAINRKEINEELFGGVGEEIKVWGFHSTLPGWNPDWDARWEEMYGYDPERAKELLAEAGYPNGFKIKVNLSTSSSVPEQVQVGEAIGLYFEAIGLDVEHTQITGAESSNRRRNREYQGHVIAISGTYRDPQFTIRTYYDPVEGIVHAYENNWLRERYLELTSATSQEARHAKEQEIGDYLYERFPVLPIIWFPGTAVVNPDVISEYVFPGNRRQIFTHMEWIKAAETR